MKFDAQKYDYPSRRHLHYATQGMVCTSQSLAAQAGVDILKKGGNAVDAAVATAACMTVVEPTSNGLGSDAFAIVWMKDEMYGLNASGFAPSGLSAEIVKEKGFDAMPVRGWLPVMVPGAPSAWAKLNERFGKLSLRECLQPAIDYARKGYAVTPVIQKLWADGYKIFSKFEGEEFKPWMETFAPKGRAPEVGEVWKCDDMAASLELIGDSQAEEFYRGSLADKIDAFSKATGGYLRKEDMARYNAQWVTPVSVNYRGYDVWEIPPNGDGIIVLMALAIMNGMELDTENPENPENYHKVIEALKLGFTDGLEFISDSKYMKVAVQELLSEEYAAARRALIGEKAIVPPHGKPVSSGTIYLCTADGEGNMVSYIQSNFKGFGSGIVIPGTGISLQDRGFSFSLNPDHVNYLKPGKKAFHTIIPSFITKDNKAIGPFGVMGAFMQPQGQLQVVSNMIDYHMNPQDALNRPRWMWNGEKNVAVEPGFPEEIYRALSEREHDMSHDDSFIAYGRGQIIIRDEEGVLCGATDPRADGCVASW